MGPLFAEVVRRLTGERPDLATVVPVGEGVAQNPAALLPGAPPPAFVTPEMGEEAKHAAFAAADAALVKSGTISLEMAAAGTPHVSAYRTSWLTAAILRRLIRVDTANLVNLVSGARVVPEFLQEHAEPGAIAAALRPLLAQDRSQCAGFAEVMAALGRGGTSPSVRAARSVLARLGAGP